ncbi:MAG: SRPBCC family protein [bacterium]|nr:SRPBCC family protein [bacterium]
MIRAEGHRVIRASVQRVWQLLSRLESHPRFTGIWMAAHLIDRSPAAPLVEFRGFFGGLPVASVQRFSLKPPGRIEFRQVRGTFLELTGAYTMRDADGETDLVAQLAVDPGIVLFSEAAVRQVLAGHIEGTLVRIKTSAERDLARPSPRRVRSPAAGGPAMVEEAGAGIMPEVEEEPEGAVEPPAASVASVASVAPAAPSAARPADVRGRRRRRRRRHKAGGQPPPAQGT